MAKIVEDCANAMEKQGYEFIAFSISGTAKSVMVFRNKEQIVEEQN